MDLPKLFGSESDEANEATTAIAHSAAATVKASLGRWTLYERAPAPMRPTAIRVTQ